MYPQTSKEFDSPNVKMLRMQDNRHGDIPFFARIYDASAITKELHGHEYTQINYVYEGACRHMIGNLVHEVREGDVFVIPPFTPHRILGEEGRPLQIIEVEFNPEIVTQDFSYGATEALLLDFLFLTPYLSGSERKVCPQLHLFGKSRTGTEALMLEIVNEFQQRSGGFELMGKSLIVALSVWLGRVYQRSARDQETEDVLRRHHVSITKAIEYIEQSYQEKLNVENVAKIAMLSTSYFCYIFKSITHKTFIEYVNDLRIEKSLPLLTTTSKSIGEICFAVGFNNISHFNRLFKQYTGFSPSAYRQASKGRNRINDKQ